MEERIEVNGVWYVREKTPQKELSVSSYESMIFENDLFKVEASRMIDPFGIPTDDVAIEYTTKVEPYTKERWDNVHWMIGVYRDSPTSVKQLYPLMGEERIKQIQFIIGTLMDKGWIRIEPVFNLDF